MDKISEEIINKVSDMNEEQKKQFLKAVKEILTLSETNIYLESKASATLNI